VRVTAEEARRGYADARDELLSRSGPPSAARRKALTALTDDWLRALYVESGAGRVGAALVAVGGYGRGDLAPGSDLDLLLLHPANASVAEVVEIADRLWYPVWDLGLKLDHSVRAPAEARRLAAQDLKVVLGLLDARTVAGDETLTRGLRESVLGDWRALAPRRLDELRDGVTERTNRSGELAHLLEPDLKDSYGGLRDLVALRAVAASWVTDAPVAGLAPQRELLLDTRDALHLVTARATDRFVLQEHFAVATKLGIDDADPADALLRQVSAAGRAVAYAADTTWHRVERLTRRGGVKAGLASTARKLRGSARNERAPLADGVVVQDGEAVLAADARPERDPATVATVAAAVGDQETLDLLHALTEADAAATGPAAWSDWKKSLIDDLVGRTRAVLEGRPRPSAPRTTAAQHRLAEAVRATTTDGVAVLLDDDEATGITTVTVAAPDRTGLLATVAGVLSLHRLQVRGAQIDTVTAPDGSRRAVQVWTVIPAYGDPPPVERVREDLGRALAGSLDVAERLAARAQGYPAPYGTAAPRVEVMPGASERATVIEVRAHDAPALLHRVTRAIAAADVAIIAARVSTLGSEVVDVFYLVDPSGSPLSQGRTATVVVTVLAALEDR